MSKPYDHWKDSEPVQRARATDAAKLSRIQSRLEASLGAAFDLEVERPSGFRATSQLRRLGWVSVGAIVAVSFSWWSLHRDVPEPPPSASVEQPQQVALAVQPAAAVPPPEEPPAPLIPPHNPQPATPKPRAASARPSEPNAARPKRAPAADGVKPAPAPGVATESGLAEELSGLNQIRALMTQSPERALATAEQQQRLFTHGALGPERALLRLNALLRLRRVAEAKLLATQLLAAPGNQLYRARIAEMLASAP